MDFRFTSEDEAFYNEVDTWLRNELGMESKGGKEEAVARAFARRLATKKWNVAGWPRQYGGLGLDFVKQAMLKELMAYYRAPNLAAGTVLAGPILMAYGTEEQKGQHLPAIATGEEHIAQWFSEPNAGSDMANTQTTAIEDGDDYVVNGVKLWHDPEFDYGLLMARTDPNAPKHRGISFFIMPRATTGVTVQPLADLSDDTPTIAQTFFDNARVSKKNLIGEPNRGWYVAMAAMNLERSGAAGPASARRNLEEILAYASRPLPGGRRLIDDPVLRHRLAEVRIEIEVGRNLAYRIASQMRAGLAPDVESSEIKVMTSEMSQRFANTFINLLGLYGLQKPESKHAALGGRFEQAYMQVLPATLAQGTSEIQRTIIATRGLGLPRG